MADVEHDEIGVWVVMSIPSVLVGLLENFGVLDLFTFFVDV